MKLLKISFVLRLCCFCNLLSYITAVDNSFIGCKYSDVCSPEEKCVDDKLFGICKPEDSLYVYEFDLDSEFASKLDALISELVKRQYSWNDMYTQCSLKTVLLQYRENLDYDISNCGPLREDSDETFDEFEQRMKRDELVSLHKYFVKDVENERDPLIDQEESPEVERFEVPQLDVNWESDEPRYESIEYNPTQLDSTENIADYENSEPRVDTNEEKIVEFLEKEAEEEEKQQEAELLNDLEEAAEKVEIQEMKDRLVGPGGGGDFGNSNIDTATEEELQQRAKIATENSRKKKANHLVSRKSNKETANPNRLVARGGHAMSRIRVSNEDPKKALAQLELTKRLLGKRTDVAIIDKDWIWIQFKSLQLNRTTAAALLRFMGTNVEATLEHAPFEINRNGKEIDIKVSSAKEYSSISAESILKKLKNITSSVPQFAIKDCGLGRKNHLAIRDVESSVDSRNFVLTAVICGSVLATVVIMVLLFFLQKHKATMDKIKEVTKTSPFGDESSESYKELCRQRMDTKNTDRTSPILAGQPVAGAVKAANSSWSEEPVQTNMDISTGHMILSYMEEHLNNKDKLEAEWQIMKAYETENVSTDHSNKNFNLDKNRFQDAVPFDHNRVVLKKPTSSGSDYINASFVVDHDPKKPSYILTQGPLVNTVSDFWQMVWEQGSVVIVCLTRLSENGMSLCFKYWPEEGSSLFNKYEVHLVSEHVWCEDYLVRSFYLKNIDSGETRTVTQFHFLNWPELSVPNNPKSILDFRRKVNKSFRGKQSPVIVHCSDGCGRSGTFTLLDMILNRTNKGVKEIDISATLEHMRDQRCDVVKSKEQFEFVLTAIAEEVNAVLKALPQ